MKNITLNDLFQKRFHVKTNNLDHFFNSQRINNKESINLVTIGFDKHNSQSIQILNE